MFKKNKNLNFSQEKEELMLLSNNDIKEVIGGAIKDTGSSYIVINISGIGTARSKIPYGGDSGRTKEEAFIEAKKLDMIDYSKTSWFLIKI